MKKTLPIALIVLIAAVLLGGVGMWIERSKRIEVYLPDGKPAKGANVWAQIVSGRAIEQGHTDEKGRVHLNRQRGGWNYMTASYWDANGKEYWGSNHDEPPSFPMKIFLNPR
jgi:hypothetical protein